jgi:hypothetical protein
VQRFVTQSALYQNNTNPLFAAQREADALMAIKQRRPVVFEYVKRMVKDKTGKFIPEWESISMYINPESLNISTQKIKSKQVTRGGIYYHHYGDDHWNISINGTTGLSGMKGIEVLERIYHHSGTLLRYQSAGPTVTYDAPFNNPYRLIDFSSTSDLLKTYMNDNVGSLKQKISKDISENLKKKPTNSSELSTYSGIIKKKTEEINLIKSKQILVDTLSSKTTGSIVRFVDQLKTIELYANAYSEIKNQVVDFCYKMAREGKSLSHFEIYNKTVAISKLKFNDKTAGSFKVTAAKSTYSASNAIVSAISLQITKEVIAFIFNQDVNVLLLKAINKYIEDEELLNEQDILKNLTTADSKYNIVKFYQEAKKEIASSFVDTVGSNEKVILSDALIRELKKNELQWLNQRSEVFQRDLEALSKQKKGTPNQILASILSQKQNMLRQQFQEIERFEARERDIRQRLEKKAFETMEDMFYDEWAPRRVIMYFENRAFIGHFEKFSYKRVADKPLIGYDLSFVAEKQILGTLM